MKRGAGRALLRVIDPVRLAALVLMLVPLAAVFGFGMLWLWQTRSMAYWLGALLVCGLAAYALQQWLLRRDRRLLAEAATEPNPEWPPDADAVWRQVEMLADELDPQVWPLDDGPRLLELALRALETVARSYHPGVERPLLELTVPHALLIIERASRDLRRDITESVPFSHRLTVGDMLRAHRWKATADRAFALYRAGRVVINPVDALIGEMWRHVRSRSFDVAQLELQRWLLRAFVRKLGYYAIDLYSGRLPLDDATPIASMTDGSSAQFDQARDDAAVPEEPLRILVLGRSNAGKSSLINALFGKLTAATDALPDTTRVTTPFILTRDGLTRALILDTPGCDSALLGAKALREAVLEADLILWVSAANRPDRQSERACLDTVRAIQASRSGRRPAPLVVAASHIDLLRPAAEWSPPYDLADAQRPKAANIRAAVGAIAADLDVLAESVVPVCLAEGRPYNVDDALWAAILAQQDAALRGRLLRCLEARRRTENWSLLRRQLIGAGRVLWNLRERPG